MAANSEQSQYVGSPLQGIELVKFSPTSLHRKCGRSDLSAVNQSHFRHFQFLVQRDTSLNDSIGVSDRVHGWRCDVTVCAHSDFECAVAARVVARQPLAHRTIDEGECVSSRYRYT
jgi:hypothetical protein